MLAPSLADPISVLRLTPSSMTRVENSSPTTTATAMMTIAVLVFAPRMFLATSAEEFRIDSPLFSILRPKALSAVGGRNVFHCCELKHIRQ